MARANASVETAAPPAAAGRVVPTRSRERRFRQRIVSFDLWSVVKISFCFYVASLVVLLVVGIVLWSIGSVTGLVDDIEGFMGELLGSDDFQFVSWRLLRGATIVGAVVVCVGVLTTVLAAAVYNLFGQLLGGVEIEIVEEERAPR